MDNGSVTLDQIISIVRHFSLADRLALISKLSDQARHELQQEGSPVDMLSLAGLGADLWREVDTDDYLDRERASWEG